MYAIRSYYECREGDPHGDEGPHQADTGCGADNETGLFNVADQVAFRGLKQRFDGEIGMPSQSFRHRRLQLRPVSGDGGEIAVSSLQKFADGGSGQHQNVDDEKDQSVITSYSIHYTKLYDMAPKGLNTDAPLAKQGYDFDGRYESFLKRWLKEVNKELTEEQIDNEFDFFIKDLKRNNFV